MSLSLSGVFEIRPDGQSGQTGYFDPTLGGTDYSQQAAPVYQATAGTTNGTTTVTATGSPFTPQMVGNGIAITSDGWYEIMAVVSAGQITVDRNTANGGAGRVLTVGGAALLGGPQFQSVLLPGHKQWVRATNSAGTPTPHSTVVSANLSASGTQTQPITTEGYSTVRGDGGRAVISNTAGLTVSGNFQIVKNLQVQGTTGVSTCFAVTGSNCWVENIAIVPGASSGVAFQPNGSHNVFRRIYTAANGSAGGGSHAVDQAGSNHRYEFCDFGQSGGQSGVNVNAPVVFRNCIIRGNAQHGIRFNASATLSTFVNCVIWGNGGDGVELTQSADGVMGHLFENCVFGKNTGYDLNYTPADISGNTGAQQWANAALLCNWFFTTGTGRYHNLPASANDHALTVDPFTSSGTGDFSLNSLSGGGADIQSTLCAAAFADGVNSANTLAGFAGTIPSGGGGDMTAALNLLISLWRERTNERSYPATSSGIPDSVVGVYLTWALHWINRIAKYHYTTDTTTIALVAGQQEYTLPSDIVEARWLRHGLIDLQRGDVERWRSDDLAWASEPAGNPREWALYGGQQIILRPAPSAEAVAEAPTCTLRYVSAPADIMTAGPAQLPTQAYRIVVDKAAAIFFEGYPDTALAEQKVAAISKEAEDAAQLFAQEMAMRSITK